MDWGQVLDLEQAVCNVETDVAGDWYQDPWRWPELRWLASTEVGRSHLASECQRDRLYQSSLIDVPKENYGTRPAIVMNPVDRLIFQGCADRASKKLITGLHPHVFGWRLERDSPSGGAFARNKQEYTGFRHRLSMLAGENDALLTTDVTGCFASLPVERLRERIAQQCGDGEISSKLTKMIIGFSKIPGRRGLAQRSLASCVVANHYLSALDGLLDMDSAGRHCRWMDDIYVFGSRWSELRRTQLRVLDAMRELGLEMNVSKTRILEGEAMQEHLDEVDSSGVAQSLHEEQDSEPLLERVQDEVIDRGESSERTTISHVCSLAAKFDVEAVAERLAEVAERLPHGADHLSRLFAYFDLGRTMVTWFLEFQASEWGEQHWSVAHLAAMLPADLQDSAEVRDRFVEMLAAKHKRAQIAVTKIAAQRICA